MQWRTCAVMDEERWLNRHHAQARAQFKRRSTANNVEILVPVPEDADSPRFRTNIGSVHYAPEKSAIIWKIKQFGGGKEFLMRAELGLPSVKGDDEHGGGMTGGFGGSMGGVGGSSAGKGKRPISVKFEIPYFTTSGIQVRYLKIIEPKVRPSNSPSGCCSLLPLRLRFGDRNLSLASGWCQARHNHHDLRHEGWRLEHRASVLASNFLQKPTC